MTESLTARYADLLGSPDPAKRELARRQMARLSPARLAVRSARGPSIWAHVKLADLFSKFGNVVHGDPDGLVETGHGPIHGSKSGRCVVLDQSTGRWWCRSCRTSGNAAAFVMAARGCRYSEAAALLTERYGPPARGPRRRRRRITFEAVVG